MKRIWIVAGAALVALVVAGAGAADLPVVKGKKIVASVQGEVITLDAFNEQLAAINGDAASTQPADARARAALLKRMIDVLLIAQEGRRMDLDKLPEIRKMIDVYARLALREQLVERIIKDVKADPAEVTKLYEEAVRQWKVSAVLVTGEEHAASLAAAVAAGQDFLDVARAYLAAGKATKVEEGIVLKREATDPAILEAVRGMAPGAVSPVLGARSGAVVVRLEELLHPDDPKARTTAERGVLARVRKDAVTAFDEKLNEMYVKVDRAMLKALDYEAPSPGIDALLEDRRALAEVKGEQPLTVADLTAELKFQFFHGTALAAEQKRLNAKKEKTLEALLHRRVFRKEALRLGLDRTPAYRAKIKEYENATLFDAVMRKAIGRDLNVKEEEVKAHYEAHRDAYATPEMMRIRSLVFDDRKAAEAAVESLRTGADFRWVESRAEAQVDREAPGVLSFDGKPVMTTELPEELRKALAGARAGETRLYASPEKHYYALAVEQVVPSGYQPYEEVRKDVGKKVVEAKIRTAMEEYADKLRSLSEVKIYLSDGAHAAQ